MADKLMPKVEESLNLKHRPMNSQILLENYIKENVADIVENDGTWAQTSSQEM